MEIEDLIYIDETGYHYADYPTFLAYFQEKYRAIYGNDIYIEPDSQDGAAIAVEAKAAYDMAVAGAATYNSFSPVSAQGTGLSRNVKINGIERRSATNSTVDLEIVGQAGTVLGVLGAPAVAVDTLEQKWEIPVGTTIPGGGSITVTATAQEPGAVNAAADTVNRIFTPTLGWQTVNNVAPATAGQPAETDAELRVRQATSTANPSLTVMEGTVGAVANLDGVTDVQGYENDTGSTDANGIPAHNISLVVAGGDTTDIAETIALHKTPGTGTYGTTSEVVTDSKGMPLTISFYRPTPVPIVVAITISAGVGWTSDYEALIEQAVSDYINEIGIGNDVLLTKIYIPAYLLNTPASGTFDIVSIELNASPANVDIDFNEQATCQPSDVNITVT